MAAADLFQHDARRPAALPSILREDRTAAVRTAGGVGDRALIDALQGGLAVTHSAACGFVCRRGDGHSRRRITVLLEVSALRKWGELLGGYAGHLLARCVAFPGMIRTGGGGITSQSEVQSVARCGIRRCCSFWTSCEVARGWTLPQSLGAPISQDRSGSGNDSRARRPSVSARQRETCSAPSPFPFPRLQLPSAVR